MVVRVRKSCQAFLPAGTASSTWADVPCLIFSRAQRWKKGLKGALSCSFLLLMETWLELKIPLSKLWDLYLSCSLRKPLHDDNWNHLHVVFQKQDTFFLSGDQVTNWVNRVWNWSTIEQPKAACQENGCRQLCAINVHIVTSKLSLFCGMDSGWEPSNSLHFWLNPVHTQCKQWKYRH